MRRLCATRTKFLQSDLEPEESDTITKRLFEIIEDQYVWPWPNFESHIRNRTVAFDIVDRVWYPDGSYSQWHERQQKLDIWPQRQAQEECGWIKRAMIITRTLHFLAKQSEGGFPMRGCREGRRYYFAPRDLYEYMWMCLNQGLGVRAWKQEPPQPPDDLQDCQKPGWYTQEAARIEEEVRSKWEQGEALEDQIPGWTREGLLAMDNTLGVSSSIRED